MSYSALAVCILAVSVVNLKTSYGAVCMTSADCKNGGTCPGSSQKCQCGAFFGDLCEHACEVTAGGCRHGGKCIITTNPRTCDCAPNFSGVQCEHACSKNSDCMNGGTCNTGVSPRVCNCNGYLGPQCADACSTDAHCENGGTCQTTTNPTTCKCKDGFEGGQCQTQTQTDSGGFTVTVTMIQVLFSLCVPYLLL